MVLKASHFLKAMSLKPKALECSFYFLLVSRYQRKNVWVLGPAGFIKETFLSATPTSLLDDPLWVQDMSTIF